MYHDVTCGQIYVALHRGAQISRTCTLHIMDCTIAQEHTKNQYNVCRVGYIHIRTYIFVPLISNINCSLTFHLNDMCLQLALKLLDENGYVI